MIEAAQTQTNPVPLTRGIARRIAEASVPRP